MLEHYKRPKRSKIKYIFIILIITIIGIIISSLLTSPEDEIIIEESNNKSIEYIIDNSIQENNQYNSVDENGLEIIPIDEVMNKN